jgi:integrase
MAQTVRDAALDTRTARSRLEVRGKPYYRLLDQGLHLGYRRNGGSGSWLVRIYDGKGGYRLERIGTADDTADADGTAILSFPQAQAMARKLHVGAARAAAGLPPIAGGPYTVANALDDYITWLEGEGRGTANISGTRGKAYGVILPKLGHLRVDRLTRKQIEDWHHALAKAPPRLRGKAGAKQRHREVDMHDPEVRRQRRTSANRVLGILKAALNHAWRNERVHDDKAWRRVNPFKGATASRARYLQLDECRRLINAANDGDDFRHMVEAGLHTGARWSALCRLKARDFNRDAGTLTVFLKDKGSKTHHVVLSEEGVAFFTEAAAKAHNREFLFVRSDGEPWKTSWQIRPMEAACKRAAITPGVGFHTLRHTWASHAIMNGAPLMVVAKNLGHADTRMVELHYGHLAPNFVTDEIRRTAPRFGMGGGVMTPFVKR